MWCYVRCTLLRVEEGKSKLGLHTYMNQTKFVRNSSLACYHVTYTLKCRKSFTKIRKFQNSQLVLSLRLVVEYHVMEQGAVETCHWSLCGHQFSRDDDIGVSISFDLEYRGLEVKSFLLKYWEKARGVTLLDSLLGLSRLCLATFEQRLAFGVTFCSSSNFQQFFVFLSKFWAK